MDIKEIQAWRTIVAILRETGYDKLYDEEVHIVAECLCRCEQRVKKQKEVIDKAINNSQYWIDYYTRLNSDERIALRLQENLDILNEVSE